MDTPARPPGPPGEDPRRRWARWLLPGIALAWFAVYNTLPPQLPGESGSLIPPAKRHRLADFTLPSLAGTDWTLARHRGRVVLLNFWATWCPPCRAEMPGLVKLAREDQARGLDVAGVDMDVGPDGPVRAFVAQDRVPYPVLRPGGRPSPADTIESYPTTLLLDRQGRVAKVYLGATSEAAFAADVARLLAEPPAAPGV